MPPARAVSREKLIDEDGNIVELVIWKVPTTPRNPAGVRYRLAFIRHGEIAPVVLYDNHHPKGHHRHLEGREEAYAFVDVDGLLIDFMADVRRLTGGLRWLGH